LYAVCAILAGGVFFNTDTQQSLFFQLASMVIVAYGFLILLTILGPRLGVGTLSEVDSERGKENISPYMLFSLILGGLIGIINLGFSTILEQFGFNIAAVGLIAITAAVVVFMGMFFRTQYAVVE
ncbi:MAG: hypothetical protein KAR20_18890, partial [Candidatus Heimdallarchaeota archaeon]|nr:hypothetical protein [Candidatus Heimdallarchaeota archaeon]